MKMKLSISTTIIIIAVITATSCCQECCTRYVIFTELSYYPDQLANCTCNITITEFLTDNKAIVNGGASCSSIEILFKSGTHNVKESSIHQPRSQLTIKNATRITFKGQPNTVLNCFNRFHIMLIDVFNIDIENMHISNCHFFITYETFYPTITTDILDSKFSNTNFKFVNDIDIDNNIMMITTIRNTIIESCCSSNKSIITIEDPSELSITLQNFNMSDNNSTLFELEVDFMLSITFTGRNYFVGNRDFIIITDYFPNNYRFHFLGSKVYIMNNTVYIRDDGSPFHFAGGTVLFWHSYVVFSNNEGSLCGGLFADDDTKISFSDNTTVLFNNNKGTKGGALSIQSRTTLIFNATKSGISLNFTNNKAQRGGAIYVEDWQYVRSMFDLQCDTTLVKLTFQSNSALFGGDEIYGGWVDWFVDENGVRYKNDTMKEILQFETSSGSDVASDPVRVCLCKDGYPDCSITNYSLEINGHAASLNLVAVGQRFTRVSAHIKASLPYYITSSEETLLHSLPYYITSSEETLLHLWPVIQSLPASCTNITYKIYSEEETVLLDPYLDVCDNEKLAIKFPKYSINDSITAEATLLFHQFYIHIKSKQCPLGFTMHKTDLNCVCQPILTSYGLSCDLKTTKIRREKQQWIGMTYEHTVTNGEYPGVIIHKYCPFDYCKTDDDSLLFRLEDGDELCAFNRSGILCGGCKPNFSRVLGSSECKKCSNLMLLLIIPSNLVAGLLLILIMMILNLTVSTGTINGLMFYANIIQAQHTTFFAPESSNSFLSMFIAWLNLDLGTEACFYNGLTSYVETWLQFCFPFYIWLLVTIIIISSHYSIYVSRLSSKNAVQVLATLVLLSYTKLLRLVIDVFSFATIAYPNGYTKAVWLYDGNVDYLKGKHIPLFIATLLLLVLLSVPYTFSLISNQWLLKISHLRSMCWVQRLKPFFDAYTGPYRVNHRYWTGLLLLARIALLIIFSLNHIDPTIRLLCITFFSFVLLAWLYFTGWVYESLLNNCLEFAFLLNLGLTSMITIFNQQYKVIYASTGIAFVIFVGIIFYHTQRQLLLTRVGAKLKKNVLSLLPGKKDEVDKDIQLQTGKHKMNESPKEVTHTVVGLSQPLLENEIN